MAARVIRNDFVAGEISPALWGRQDQELYHHGAARIENFIPVPTGGLRKRAGTELVWRLSVSGGTDFRAFPYTYDRDEFGIMVLRSASGSIDVSWSFKAFYADGTTATAPGGGVLSGAVFQLGSGESIEDIKCVQFGDTLMFTMHGHSAFKAAVTFKKGALSVAWSTVQSQSKSTTPASGSLTATPHAFHAAGDGYTTSKALYGLFGIKNGVWSAMRKASANITLPWTSGAYVTLEVQADWTKHDSYALVKQYAGQYGVIQMFYPDDFTRCDQSEVVGFSVSGTASATFGGTEYSGLASNPTATWKNGGAQSGTFCSSFTFFGDDGGAVLTAIDMWFGSLATINGGANNRYIGNPGFVKVRLHETSTSGPVIDEWSFDFIQYRPGSVRLKRITAAVSQDGVYAIDFVDASGNATKVAMRGFNAYIDYGSRTFKDVNIAPVSNVSIPEQLTVGDSGMDVDIISLWQQRLVAAGSASLPFTMWFSAVGDLYNFTTARPQAADDAFEATIATTDANRILHIVAQKWMLVMAENGEFTVDAQGGALAYNTLNIRKVSSIGAHPDVEPVVTENEIVFAASDGRCVYKMDYSLERDSVVPSRLSTRAAHLTEGHAIVGIAYQRYPDSVLWCLLDDGSLASLTFLPDENVIAWARHTLAGGGGLKAVGIFAAKSMRSDDGTDTTTDVFLILRSDAEGDEGKVWIERLRPCVVSDAPLSSGAQCSDHMGYSDSDYPAGGNPQGDVAASIETLRLDPQGGEATGAQTNVFDTVLRIRRSGAVSVRPAGAGSAIAWSGTATQPDAVPQTSGSGAEERVSLVRRDVRISPRAFQNKDNRIEIKSADKWPCEILSLETAVHFGDIRRT